jgi:hypothetical protein
MGHLSAFMGHLSAFMADLWAFMEQPSTTHQHPNQPG